MNMCRRFSNHLILFLLCSALLACAPKKTAAPIQGGITPSPAYEQLLDQAKNLINDRKHKDALIVLDKAGHLEPNRPEWLYERARALFYMDRFDQSAEACKQALKNDPKYYDALSFGWAAQIEADNGSDQIKQAVREEIESLLQTSPDQADVLLTAYQGYEYLKDIPAQQTLILELARLSSSLDDKKSNAVAQELFEQIIQAKNNTDMQMQLMEAYIRNFPHRRFVEYVVKQLLTIKQETATEDVPPEQMVASTLEAYPKSRRISTGIAVWLINQNLLPEEAVRLLQESLASAEHEPEEKPPFFSNKLWDNEVQQDRDYLHFLLGIAFYDEGKFDSAKTQLSAIDAQKRHWGKVYHYLGMIAMTEDKPEDAISYFYRALSIDEYQEETQQQLLELLSQYEGYQGDPAEYFAKKSGVIQFDDVTEDAGLAGQNAHRVAWGDYNQDGFVDLLVDGHRLFQNAGDETFVDVTEASGLGALTTPTGGVWGDYDNDGFPDIFVTDHSGNHLFRNMGDGTFHDMTQFAFGSLNPLMTEAAAWVDLDNDGFLDLYTANYERPGVMRAIGVQDKIYHNNGNGTFADVSDNAGIHTDEAMCGRGVTCTDVNRDGYQDIVVANYRLDPNFLWINNHDGTFTDQAGVFGVRGSNVDGAFGHSIGPVAGDLNQDGVLDLFITNLAHPRYIEYSDKDMLLINQGPPKYYYTDRFSESGIAFEETNSDPALADIDNDGDLDLYMTSIYPGRYSHLYLNDGKGSFTDVTWLSGTSTENAWGAAFADFNNDGFVDLAVASDNGLTLFSNNGSSNHWIKVKIKDKTCNHPGIGAVVTISYGNNQQVREITAGRGTGSQDGPAVIFGLGDYNGPVNISARTPCGDAFEATASTPDHAVTLIP